MKKTCLFLAAMSLCSGCATTINLPEVSADKFEYHRTDPLGGTHVTASGVSVDKEAGVVRADTVTWNTTYPAFSVQATINGYERKLAK